MLELNDQNYYTPEADREYMSCSQYQDFLKCEAAAMAKLEGRYVPQDTEALLVGNYFHTALESAEAHDKFCNDHFENIFKTKTDRKSGEVVISGKYAPYEKADVMLDTLRSDRLINSVLSLPGENEKIMTGELFGIPWKIKLDKYCAEDRIIIDYKTTADINKTEYNPETGERDCFVEYLGYMMRAAVYSEIEKQNTGSETDPKFLIIAISKQDPPDKGVYLLNHRQRYDFELEQVKKNLVHIMDVKNKRFKPRRCGKCEYCRATKSLQKIVPYYTLKPGYQDVREEEYDEFFTMSESLENA